ncbi:MAG: motility associated factor glycosyltransferase family protein [Deltaproteobacteria bacterium]|nr:motility associated factor glycosyltransferase family protein [Deltaproteobacteria bacterium]
MAVNEKQSESFNGELFWESNLNLIGIPTPLVDKLRHHKPSGTKIETAKNGVPLLALHGVDVYDRQDPIGIVKGEVAAIRGDDDANVVALFGLGLGYHAQELARRFTGQIVVFDPSLDAMKTTLGSRRLPLERTILVSNPGHLVSEVQPRLQFTDRKIIAAAIPAYVQLFPDEFKTFKSILEEAISNSQILEATIAERSLDWIRNIAKNLPTAMMRPSINVIGDRFAGKPGILVAAGPSLGDNIEHLKKAMGHALIISVNAAAEPLSRAGVSPDIITVVEGLDLRAQLEGIDRIRDVTLAASIIAFPGFFDMNVRHLFPIADYSTVCSEWFSSALGWHRYPSGGSVACTAFAILHELGCDPIILVGQDLAYTDGKSYVESATYGRQRMEYNEKTGTLNAVERNSEIEEIRKSGGLDLLNNLKAEETEAYGGVGMVRTIAMFNLFRNWFETSARTWAADRTLINATEGGARIKAFEEMPLSTAIEKWCVEPVLARDWIDEAVNEASPSNTQALFDIIKEVLNDTIHAAEIADQARRTAAFARRQIEKNNMTKAESSLAQLAVLEAELQSASNKNRLLDVFVSGKVNKLRLKRSDDRDDDPNRQAANSLRRSERLFEAVHEGARHLLEIFDQIHEMAKAGTLPSASPKEQEHGLPSI